MNATLFAQIFNLVIFLCVIAALVGFAAYFLKSRVTVFRNVERIANELTEIRKLLEENRRPLDK